MLFHSFALLFKRKKSLNVYTHTELAQVPPKPSNAFSRHRDLARLGSVLFRQRSSKDPFAPWPFGSLHLILSCYNNEDETCCQWKQLSENALSLSAGRAGRACRPQVEVRESQQHSPTAHAVVVPHRHTGTCAAPSVRELSCQASMCRTPFLCGHSILHHGTAQAESPGHQPSAPHPLSSHCPHSQLSSLP